MGKAVLIVALCEVSIWWLPGSGVCVCQDLGKGCYIAWRLEAAPHRYVGGFVPVQMSPSYSLLEPSCSAV